MYGRIHHRVMVSNDLYKCYCSYHHCTVLGASVVSKCVDDAVLAPMLTLKYLPVASPLKENPRHARGFSSTVCTVTLKFALKAFEASFVNTKMSLPGAVASCKGPRLMCAGGVSKATTLWCSRCVSSITLMRREFQGTVLTNGATEFQFQ